MAGSSSLEHANNHEIQDSQRQHQLELRVALISMNVHLEPISVTEVASP